MKILIADGDAVFGSVLKEKLEKERIDVEILRNGSEVHGRAKEFKPDLIVMDLVLPQKEGFDVLTELKDDSTLKSVPVMIVTDIFGDEDIKRALDAGAVNYYVKSQHPVTEIVQNIKDFLIMPKDKQSL